MTIKLPELGVEITLDGKGNGSITSNLGLDHVESLLLAHACAGVDVTHPAYIAGVKTALDAISNHSEE